MGPRGCLKDKEGLSQYALWSIHPQGSAGRALLASKASTCPLSIAFLYPNFQGSLGFSPAEESPGTPLLLPQSCPGTAAVWRVTQQAAAAWWGGLNFFLALSATRLGEDSRGGSLGSGRSSSWLDNGGTRSWGTGPALWRGDCSQALPSPGLESRKTPMRERRAPGL